MRDREPEEFELVRLLRHLEILTAHIQERNEATVEEMKKATRHQIAIAAILFVSTVFNMLVLFIRQ